MAEDNDAMAENEACGVNDAVGFGCTKPAGHDGPHAAHAASTTDNGEPIAVWDAEGYIKCGHPESVVDAGYAGDSPIEAISLED